MTPITAWALKGSDGEIYEVAMHKSTILDNLFDTPSEWQRKYDEGYRCVRVTVQEVKE